MHILIVIYSYLLGNLSKVFPSYYFFSPPPSRRMKHSLIFFFLFSLSSVQTAGTRTDRLFISSNPFEFQLFSQTLLLLIKTFNYESLVANLLGSIIRDRAVFACESFLSPKIFRHLLFFLLYTLLYYVIIRYRNRDKKNINYYESLVTNLLGSIIRDRCYIRSWIFPFPKNISTFTLFFVIYFVTLDNTI